MVDFGEIVLSLAQPGTYREKEAAELLKKCSETMHGYLIQECAKWDRGNLLDLEYGYANTAAYLIGPLAMGDSQSSGRFATSNKRMILALYAVEAAAVFGGHGEIIGVDAVRTLNEMALRVIECSDLGSMRSHQLGHVFQFDFVKKELDRSTGLINS